MTARAALREKNGVAAFCFICITLLVTCRLLTDVRKFLRNVETPNEHGKHTDRQRPKKQRCTEGYSLEMGIDM